MFVRCKITIWSEYGKTRELAEKITQLIGHQPEESEWIFSGKHPFWIGVFWIQDPWKLKKETMPLEWQGKERIADIDIFVGGEKLSRKEMNNNARPSVGENS